MFGIPGALKKSSTREFLRLWDNEGLLKTSILNLTADRDNNCAEEKMEDSKRMDRTQRRVSVS